MVEWYRDVMPDAGKEWIGAGRKLMLLVRVQASRRCDGREPRSLETPRKVAFLLPAHRLIASHCSHLFRWSSGWALALRCHSAAHHRISVASIPKERSEWHGSPNPAWSS